MGLDAGDVVGARQHPLSQPQRKPQEDDQHRHREPKAPAPDPRPFRPPRAVVAHCQDQQPEDQDADQRRAHQHDPPQQRDVARRGARGLSVLCPPPHAASSGTTAPANALCQKPLTQRECPCARDAPGNSDAALPTRSRNMSPSTTPRPRSPCPAIRCTRLMVAFPIALAFSTFGADAMYWLTADEFWPRVALWATARPLAWGPGRDHRHDRIADGARHPLRAASWTHFILA